MLNEKLKSIQANLDKYIVYDRLPNLCDNRKRTDRQNQKSGQKYVQVAGLKGFYHRWKQEYG